MAPKRNQAEAFSLSSSALSKAASKAQGLATPSLQTNFESSRNWHNSSQSSLKSPNDDYGHDYLSPYGGHSDDVSTYDSSVAGDDMSDFDHLLNLDEHRTGPFVDKPTNQPPISYHPTNTIAPHDIFRSPPVHTPAHLLTPAITSSPSPKITQSGPQGTTSQSSRQVNSPSIKTSPSNSNYQGTSASSIKQGPWSSTSSIGSPLPTKVEGSVQPTQYSRPGHTEGNMSAGNRIDDTGSNTDQGLEPAPLRVGIKPSNRAPLNEAEIPTLEEEKKQRDVKAKNEGVEQWLQRTTDKSQKTTPAASMPPTRDASSVPQSQASAAGHLTDEDENDDDSDEEEDWEKRTSMVSPPTPRASHEHVLQTMAEASSADGDPASLSRGFRTMNLWSDSPHDDDAASVKQVPESSTRAIERFTRRAREVETVSIAATYASSRRDSRADTLSIFSTSGISQRKPSYAMEDFPILEHAEHEHEHDPEHDHDHEHAPRKDSLLNKMQRSFSKQTHRLRKESNETVRGQEHAKRPSVDKSDSQSSTSTLRKTPSVGQQGRHVQQDQPKPGLSPHPTGSFHLPGKKGGLFRRPRSRSDLGNERRHSVLAQQWAASGGPPVAFVNTHHRESISGKDLTPGAVSKSEEPVLKRETVYLDTQEPSERPVEADDDDEEATTPTTGSAPVALPSSATYEGFVDHARRISPRIEPFLLDRVAQEQVKRYRILVDMRIEHHQRAINNTCENGQRCADLGTGPKYLRPPKSRADKDEKSAIFQVSVDTPIQEIEHLNNDETPQLATFPEGIPPPPVKQLPAEFECPICFKIKRLQKPSDWSKHCFEDLYPFLCSFNDCSEPKSFNRKADWSRHESERHLKLETWTCCFQDCSHVCHRRDNFIQHLVRAHKMQEPKAPGNRRRTAEDDSEVSRLAKDCHRDTPQRPEDQKCPFCASSCNAWKKLAVHLANHMKQINLPLLALIEKEDISKFIAPVNGSLFDTSTLMQWRRQASIAQNYAVPVGTPSVYTGSMSPQPPTQQNFTGDFSNGTIMDANGQPMVHPAFQGSFTFPGSKNLPRQASPWNGTASSGDSYGNRYQADEDIDPFTSVNMDPLGDARAGQRTPTPATYPPPFMSGNGHANLSTNQQMFHPTIPFDDGNNYTTSPIFDDGPNIDAIGFNPNMHNGMTGGTPVNNNQYLVGGMGNDQGFMPAQSQAARNAQYNAQLAAQQNANTQYRDNRMNQNTVYYDADDFGDDYGLNGSMSNSQYSNGGQYGQQAIPGQQQQQQYGNHNTHMYNQGGYGR